jgi:ATP-binding cassette, subfamily F, member 3
MILDEVSNNLDIETIDAVIIALGQCNCGIVLVSHDEHLVDSVCDEIFVVGDPPGSVKRFKAQFKDYRKVAVQEVAVQGGKGGAGAADDSSDDD